MKKALLSILVILMLVFIFSGCGEEINPDYLVLGVPVVIEEGIDGPAQEDLEHAVYFYLDKLYKEIKVDPNILRKKFNKLSHILFQSDFLEVEYNGHGEIIYRVTGYYVWKEKSYSDARIELTWSGCIGISALFHELTHHYLRQIITRENSDKEHKSDWWLWVHNLEIEYVSIPAIIEYCRSVNAAYPI